MKLTKVLLGTTFAVPSLVVPLTTMTSCSQSWGNKTPFTIGSDNAASPDNPYAKFTTKTYLDVDGVSIVPYLQSNYAIQPSRGLNFAYSAPMRFNDENEEQPEEHGWELANCGWYTSADGAFARAAVDKYKDPEGKIVSKTVTNAQNATLSPNIDFVSSIGSGINNYISAALYYLISLVRNDDVQKTDKNLGIAVGKGAESSYRTQSFYHGTKGGTDAEQNNRFFEFICSLANLVGEFTVEALLKTSSVNFNFEQFPLPSYTFDGDKHTISSEFVKLLEGNDGVLGLNGKYWSNKSNLQKQTLEDKTDVWYRTYTYENVPIKVHVQNLSKTFLNPTNTKDGKAIDSFLPNDYYSTNEQVTKAVGESWKPTLEAFTSRQTFNPEYKTFTLQTPSTGRTVNLPTEKFDVRVSNVHGSDFIILMNYYVNIYQKTEDEEPAQADYLPEKDTATISSIANIFPAYFIDLYKQDLFKKIKDEDECTTYVFNTSKINEKNGMLIGLLNRTNDQGRIVDLDDEKLTKESKNFLTFLAYMFGGSDKVLNTANFIEAKDPIES